MFTTSSRPRAGFFFVSAERISLAVAALLATLPFLLPEHRPPLPSFYDEWLAVALAAIAWAALLVSRVRHAALPELCVWLALFAAWLGLQATLRAPAYPQLPIAGIVYVLFAAQLACLGHALAERLGTERVVDVLASAILAAALLNAAIGIVQHHGVPRFLGDFIATGNGPRIVGHVGQANLLADYLALGQAALLYLVARGRMRAPWWWAAAALLVLASAYTQSRGAIVFSLWLCALALSLRQRGPQWRGLAAHAAILALATIVLPWLIRFSALERLPGTTSDPRLELWPLAWRLFLDSPWLGVGWGEFGGAATAAGESAAWMTAHNLVLQLLAEAGAIGALLVCVALARWWLGAWRGLRKDPTLAHWWIAAVIGVISVHALVEEPLWYAHVLGLAALVCGIASRPLLSLRALPLGVGSAVLGVLWCALLAWTFVDYQRFDRSYLVASGRTLAAPAEVAAAREDLRALAHGPLGAHVGRWLNGR